MPRGLLRKLLSTYFIIIALIIILLAALLSQFLKFYFLSEKQKVLINSGRQVNTQLIKYSRGDISKKELNQAVNIIGQTTNSRIVVINPAGKNIDRSYLEQDLGIKDRQLLNTLQKVMEGEIIIRKRQFAKELNTYVIAVGIPVEIANKSKGAILLFSPVNEVDQALVRVYKIIWLTALLSLALGTVVIYVISKKISRPLVEVSRMAEEIARGRKVADLNLHTADEVGQLIKSFNFMKNQLDQTEKMRKELLASVSHDLRTPLTAIRGFIQGILDGVIKAGEQEKYLQLAFAETNRLTRLTNDVLDLAKLESGGISLVKSRVNVRKMALEVLASLAVHSQAKNISTSVSSADIWIMADEDRIKQILWNLLVNAVSYTGEGGWVKVEMALVQAEAIIRIIDNGIGIPEEEQPLVFDRFYRVDKSRNLAMGGTGLGLAIVKNLVKLHGGTINIKSATGEGTIMEITLPVNLN